MRYLMVMGLVFLLCLFDCSPSNSEGASNTEPLASRNQTDRVKAPLFVLKDLNGKDVKLNDYNGRDVLLIFGATWCGYCKSEIPNLKQSYKKYKEEGFEIINIYVQESAKKVSSFVKKHKIPYKVILDETGIVARQYGVMGFPTHCLIGREGDVLCIPCRNIELILGMLYKNKVS